MLKKFLLIIIALSTTFELHSQEYGTIKSSDYYSLMSRIHNHMTSSKMSKIFDKDNPIMKIPNDVAERIYISENIYVLLIDISTDEVLGATIEYVYGNDTSVVCGRPLWLNNNDSSGLNSDAFHNIVDKALQASNEIIYDNDDYVYKKYDLLPPVDIYLICLFSIDNSDNSQQRFTKQILLYDETNDELSKIVKSKESKKLYKWFNQPPRPLIRRIFFSIKTIF